MTAGHSQATFVSADWGRLRFSQRSDAIDLFDSVFWLVQSIKTAEFTPYLKSLCGGQVPIKVAIGFFRLLEISENADRAVGHKKY